jgi:hypothetical protein
MVLLTLFYGTLAGVSLWRARSRPDEHGRSA